jgi:hypothetical protein
MVSVQSEDRLFASSDIKIPETDFLISCNRNNELFLL